MNKWRKSCPIILESIGQREMSMKKHELMILADYSKETSLDVKEVCEACHISSNFIYDLIEYEIIHPQGIKQEEWMFNLDELKRIKTALRLQHDLEVNLAGVALVLDLLDQLEDLRKQVELMHKHY